MSHGNRIERQRSGVCSSSVWPKMPRGINGGHVFHDRNRCQDKSWVLSRLGAVSDLSDGSHGIRDEVGWGFGNCIYSRAEVCPSYSDTGLGINRVFAGVLGRSAKGLHVGKRGTGNCWLDLIETTELLVKFDIAKRASGRFAVGGPKFSSLN